VFFRAIALLHGFFDSPKLRNCVTCGPDCSLGKRLKKSLHMVCLGSNVFLLRGSMHPILFANTVGRSFSVCSAFANVGAALKLRCPDNLTVGANG
jgi:hypothetical protein